MKECILALLFVTEDFVVNLYVKTDKFNIRCNSCVDVPLVELYYTISGLLVIHRIWIIIIHGSWQNRWGILGSLRLYHILYHTRDSLSAFDKLRAKSLIGRPLVALFEIACTVRVRHTTHYAIAKSGYYQRIEQ